MRSEFFSSSPVRTAWVVALAFSGACTIVDSNLTDQLDERVGAQLVGGNVCGESGTPLINAIVEDGAVQIDTRQAANSTDNSCGRGTPGNDLFFAVDVTAGDYWHFHLRALPDPDNGNMIDRDPILYLFSSGPEGNDGSRTCGDRSCEFYADRCESSSDEHFAFVASQDGRWYVGVDDHNEGGGLYELTAFHPNCRDGNVEHGEACDDGNDVSNDSCDNACRKVIANDGATESLPNDNIVEANVLSFDSEDILRIRGAVGGQTNCYPDVYAVNVPEGGQLRVEALASFAGGSEVACDGSTNAPFEITLTDRNGGNEVSGGVDLNGCPILGPTAALAAGEYIITVDEAQDLEEQVAYWMRFELL